MFSHLGNQFLNVHSIMLFYPCIQSFLAMIARGIFCGGILVGDPFVSRYFHLFALNIMVELDMVHTRMWKILDQNSMVYSFIASLLIIKDVLPRLFK